MSESFRLLSETVPADPNRVIYHTDLDELPSRSGLLTAVKALEAGDCDGISGKDEATMNAR